MSNFYARLNNGIHKERTMRGFKTQGLTCDIGSYKNKVTVMINDDNGKDIITIYVNRDCVYNTRDRITEGN